MNWDSYISSGTQALQSANLTVAQRHFEDALAFAKKNFFHNDPRIPQTLVYLGQTYFGQQKFSEAAPLLTLGVQLAGANNFNDDLSVGMSLLCLGEIATVGGRNADASRFLIEGTELLRNVLTESELARVIARVKQSNSSPAPAGLVPDGSSQGRLSKPAAPQSLPNQPQPSGHEQLEEVLRSALRTIKADDKHAVRKAYVSIVTGLPQAISTAGIKSTLSAQFLNVAAMAATGLELFDRAEPAYKKALSILEEVLPEGAAETALVRLNLATMYVLKADYEAADDNFQRAMIDLNGDPAVDEGWLEETAEAFNEVEATWELELRADELMDQARVAESKLNYGMALEALDQAFSGYRTAPLARDKKLAELFEIQARLLKSTGGDEAEIARLLHSVSVIRAEEKAREMRIAQLSKSLPPLPDHELPASP